MAAMRVFTGIQLAAGPREKLLRELKPFHKAGTPIRWTAERNIHLTLKFIGEADPALAGRIGAALAAAPRPAPFRLRLRGLGKFPGGDELHVLWAGVEESAELNALFAAMEEQLAALGIARETRPFHPHVTLGRNKSRHDFKGVVSLLQERIDRFLGDWDVDAYQLFASDLTPAGPVYTVQKEIPLVES
jgi:2'-5' RNA ligase